MRTDIVEEFKIKMKKKKVSMAGSGEEKQKQRKSVRKDQTGNKMS